MEEKSPAPTESGAVESSSSSAVPRPPELTLGEGTEQSKVVEVPLTGITGTCRICCEDADTSKLLSPCGCTGDMAYVHRACLQTWISTPKKNASYDGEAGHSVCEICGQAWKEKFHIPSGKRPTEEDERQRTEERIQAALTAAYFRVVHGIQRERDAELLRVVGSRFSGPWDQQVAQMTKKKSSVCCIT